MERTPSDFLRERKLPDDAGSLHDAADEALEASYLEQARESIVETVMLFGQYPQPRSTYRPMTTAQAHQRVKFSLQEFLFDEAASLRVDQVEAEELFVLALIDRGEAFTDSRDRWEKRVTKMLNEHFTDDHELVREVAEKLKQDDQP